MADSRIRNLLHESLLLTQKAGRLPWPWTALVVVLAVLLLGLVTGSTTLAFWLALWALADWLLLASLPRRGLAYGTVQPTHVALLALRWFLAWAAEALLARWPGVGLAGKAVTWGLQPLLWGLALYATTIEPFRLGITEATLHDEKASPHARPLSILQIGDIHVERLGKREQRLLEIVDRLQPDLILLTGDYLNLSYVGEERAVADARRLLGQLRARYGVYAVRGTPEVDTKALMPVLFAGLGITVLEGERRDLEIDGHRLRIIGVGCDRDLRGDSARLHAALAGAPDGYYTILLYHMPDLMDAASLARVDLYLAGHTHGGQLRLPFVGALITGSQFGKLYEMGWHRKGSTRLYVARGLGLEGMGAPRARFLCPPEVVHIRLEGRDDSRAAH